MEASVVADWAQVAANAVTALGIIFAAVASVRLRLFRGRPQISIDNRVLRKRTDNEGAVIGASVLITVTVKNTGRSRLRIAGTDTPRIFLTPITPPPQKQDGVLLTSAFDEAINERGTRAYDLFRRVPYLEPDDEVADGLAIDVAGEFELLKVDVFLSARAGLLLSRTQGHATQILYLHEETPSNMA